jgi:hypothetical protein
MSRFWNLPRRFNQSTRCSPNSRQPTRESVSTTSAGVAGPQDTSDNILDQLCQGIGITATPDANADMPYGHYN